MIWYLLLSYTSWVYVSNVMIISARDVLGERIKYKIITGLIPNI